MKIAAAGTIFLLQVMENLLNLREFTRQKKGSSLSELWLPHRQLFTGKGVAQTLGRLSIVNFLQAVGVTVGLIKAA